MSSSLPSPATTIAPASISSRKPEPRNCERLASKSQSARTHTPRAHGVHIAASFEIGAKQHDLDIKPIGELDLPINIRPDWPIFTLQGRTVFLEADTGTETINADVDSQATNIREKFEHYLALIHSKAVKRPFIAFVTTKRTRRDSFIERLKRVIDQNRYPHEYAECFGFASIDYDRYLNAIPEPSAWAVEKGFLRAGHDPFIFANQKVR